MTGCKSPAFTLATFVVLEITTTVICFADTSTLGAVTTKAGML